MRREILRLAIPAFLTLVAEPLFLLADSAIVGHLGTEALAALGVASSILLTAVGVFVFLAYGTTSVVARRLGAGDETDAVAAGVDGLWLSVGLGALAAVVLAVAAPALCAAIGGSPGVQEQATIYLRISAIGLPAMLVVLGATGLLRGFQDTRTPLVVAVAGFGANIVLNLALVYGAGLGIAGSAIGTVLAQTGMAVALVVTVVRKAIQLGAPLSPHTAGILVAARGGVPLLVRTLALRGVIIATTVVAARYGDTVLAAHQIVMTVWNGLAFALDALAIAAQAITGKALGAGDVGPGAGGRQHDGPLGRRVRDRHRPGAPPARAVHRSTVQPGPGRGLGGGVGLPGGGDRPVAGRVRVRRRRGAHGRRGHGVAGGGHGGRWGRLGTGHAVGQCGWRRPPWWVRPAARRAVGVVRDRVPGPPRRGALVAVPGR